MQSNASSLERWRRPLLSALAAFIYLAAFLMLDAAAAVFELQPGLEPWDPAAATSLGFLLRVGPAWAPLVFLANLTGLMWRLPTAMPSFGLGASAALPAAVYAALAWWMRRPDRTALGEPNVGRLFRRPVLYPTGAEPVLGSNRGD